MQHLLRISGGYVAYYYSRVFIFASQLSYMRHVNGWFLSCLNSPPHSTTVKPALLTVGKVGSLTLCFCVSGSKYNVTLIIVSGFGLIESGATALSVETGSICIK